MSAKIIDALTVVAEITGATLSVPAIRGMAMELAQHPEDAVLKALARCKRECKYRLTLADVLERLSVPGGHVGADEAWSIAIQAMDESVTVVMTEEISQAWGVARDVMPDRVGARMAFREVYDRLVQQAKDENRPAHWFPSLGRDKQGRAAPLLEAVRLGRLTNDCAQGLLPAAQPKQQLSIAQANPTSPVSAHHLIAQMRSALRIKNNEKQGKSLDGDDKTGRGNT
ncbi:MAG TPA: hypothetical protein VFV57_05825 [Limnobacter sp.]|nr:hypothetical protein [Limnobacter sp.]